MAVELHDDDDCYQTPIWPTEPLDFQEDHLDPDEDDLLFSGGESAMMVLHDRLILDKAISANFNSGDLEMSQIQFNSTGTVTINLDSHFMQEELRKILSLYLYI